MRLNEILVYGSISRQNWRSLLRLRADNIMTAERNQRKTSSASDSWDPVLLRTSGEEPLTEVGKQKDVTSDNPRAGWTRDFLKKNLSTVKTASSEK